MANFNTHLTVSAVTSGALATLFLQVGFVDSSNTIILLIAGVIGGILPDIDLHYSYPSRILFSLLGVVIALLWIFSAENELSIVALWGAGLGIYLFVRFPIWTLFYKMTRHRGSVHSILTALLFGFLTVNLSFYLFGKGAFVSWVISLFVFMGFILHLLLDELYSVDFMGHRLKRSFGTALKPFDSREKISSGVILLGLSISWFFAPNADQFIDTLLSVETYRLIYERLF